MSLSRRAILSGSGLFVLAPRTLRAQSPNPDGFRILEATQRTEAQTAIFSYQGSVPGPTIRIRQGDELRVRLINRLDQPTTLHWHGCALPNAMDGAAGITQEGIQPGASFDYRFTATDSGTFWYHPGTFADRNRQIAGGLFGPLVIEERQSPPVHQELLLTLHDASAVAPDTANAAPKLFINGAVAPLLASFAPTSRLRLRLINACAYRVAVISFDNLKPVIAAIDGQPSDLFEPVHGTIPLGPGARADVFVDLPAEPLARARLILRGEGEADYDVVELAVRGEAVAALPPIAPLPVNPALPTDINLAKAKRLDLVADASAAFKLVAAPGSKGAEAEAVVGKPIFVVKRGTPVSLGFRNLTATVQGIHLHGHAMRLLHPLDDGWEPYWRDGFLLPPQKTSRVAFVADKPGKWVIEAASLVPDAPIRFAFFEVI
jgi:FtsP/CotA-like multicopper oxidase with cupredoxin domain